MSYKYTYTRLDKLRKTYDGLIKTNQELVAKVKLLQKQIGGMQSTHLAQENVLRSISHERDNLLVRLSEAQEQIRKEDRTTAK